MKLRIPIVGRGRNAMMVLAGLGTATALTLAPVGAGVLEVGQAAAATGTSGTTIVTSSTATAWTATSTTVTVNTTHAKAVCTGPHQATVPGTALTTVPAVTWLWATVGQPSCTATTRPPPVTNGAVTLTQTFIVTGIPQAAKLYFAADDWASVSINGTPVTLTAPMTAVTDLTSNHNTNYTTVHTATVTTLLAQGSNTITITAKNTGNSTNGSLPSTGPNPAGVGVYLPIAWTTTTANLCKKTGWRSWNTPKFQNQGDCVSYFVKNANGNDPTIPNTANS